MSYTPATEPARAHAGIKYEVEQAYCRDVVTIASGSNTAGTPLAELTLLGKITASDKYAPHDPEATDGTLISPDIDAGSADADAVEAVKEPRFWHFRQRKINNLRAKSGSFSGFFYSLSAWECRRHRSCGATVR
jgi:hypothetical protein